MNTNYDVQLLYNETILDGMANLNSKSIVAHLYLSNLGSRRGRDSMVAKIYSYLCKQCLKL